MLFFLLIEDIDFFIQLFIMSVYHFLNQQLHFRAKQHILPSPSLYLKKAQSEAWHIFYSFSEEMTLLLIMF